MVSKCPDDFAHAWEESESATLIDTFSLGAAHMMYIWAATWKTYFAASSSNEDSTQPAHPRSLLSLCFLREDILHLWLSKMRSIKISIWLQMRRLIGTFAGCTFSEGTFSDVAANLVFNPFLPIGLFYFNSSDRSISNSRGVWLLFKFTISYGILYTVASDLSLHCLPFTLLGISRLQCVNGERSACKTDLNINQTHCFINILLTINIQMYCKDTKHIQLTLVISTSLISNNRYLKAIIWSLLKHVI